METKADIFNQDCIGGMAERVADDSIHLTVTSIPFEELFTYSGKLEDVGNNGSTVDVEAGRFMLNLRFVIDQLLRVHAPGTNCCVHIQQLLAYKNQHGFMGRRDFRGAVINGFRAGGFNFTGEAVIPKDPQAMAQRLSLHSLQFKTGYARSSTNWAPAVNDYVLIFQKPGQVKVPVRCLRHDPKNPNGWLESDTWVKWARGVWDDVDEFDVLDGARSARESDEEKHVCPLQLEIIRRCILLYTNPASVQPDVTVLDPFMGIGSTAHVAIGARSPHTSLYVSEPRHVIGFELKESYHANAIKNVARARRDVEKRQTESEAPTLMSLMAGGGGGGSVIAR
jgi:DNA modification methylase